MSDIITRPMLAATVEMGTLDKIRWPVRASPKIDGIRCLMHPELGPVSRTFKPIPNEYVRERLEQHCGGSNLDGELYAVNEDGSANFNDTQSALMSRSGQPRFRYAVFDCFDDPGLSFAERTYDASKIVQLCGMVEAYYLHHTTLFNPEDLATYAEECLRSGYEGVVIRDVGGPYKSGRSTLSQGWMVKYKPWADAEGTIIGFEELYHNANPQESDAFGLAKRSSHKDNLVPAGVLGALVLGTAWGALRVGTGFDYATRKAIWERNQPGIIRQKEATGAILVTRGECPDAGRTVTFKYQKHGMQDLPRFPVFLRFRED